MPKRSTAPKTRPELEADFRHLTDTSLASLESIAGRRRPKAMAGFIFHDEHDTLPDAVETARQGLSRMSRSGPAVVSCVGPTGQEDLLEKVVGAADSGSDVIGHGILLDSSFEGDGWALRALLEAAVRLQVPLVVLRPDLVPQQRKKPLAGRGFSAHWPERLLAPLAEGEAHLALARFTRHPLGNAVESFLAYPVVTGVFGLRLRQPVPGVFAVSPTLAERALADASEWMGEIGAHGVEMWLLGHALAEGLRVCEVPLGLAAFGHDVGRLKLVFHQVAHACLQQVRRYERVWLKRGCVLEVPGICGGEFDVDPAPHGLSASKLRRRFRFEFNHFDETLLREILPDDFRERIEDQIDSGNGVMLTNADWARVLQDFLIASRFNRNFHPDDIVDALFPFFLARLASFMDETAELGQQLSAGQAIPPRTARHLMRHEAEHRVDVLASDFATTLPEFRKRWSERQAEAAPYLPRLGEWEFVPNVGILVPQTLDRADGSTVWASEVYQEILNRYRAEFTRFLSEQLGATTVEDGPRILLRLREFMLSVESALSHELFPYKLTTCNGAQRMIEAVLEALSVDDEAAQSNGSQIPPASSYQLTEAAARLILAHAPPANLILQQGAGNVTGLLQQLDPRDAIALAAWTDQPYYLERVVGFIEKEGTPDWFHVAPIRPVVLDVSTLGRVPELSGTSALARIAGRVGVVNLEPGLGGDFPVTWYLLRIAHSVVATESFSHIWNRLARDPETFGKRVAASIRGHWGRQVLSAHNAFKNGHQRTLIGRLRAFAEGDENGRSRAGQLLKAAAEVYHLSITLPDATFVPLSMWTWSGFSYRGGIGAPTPLSSLVERDWATRDFLTLYIERAGLGDLTKVNRTIEKLVVGGRERENLAQHLLAIEADPDRVVVRQPAAPVPPHAAKLVRPVEGPILEPIADHKWESRYVLNAAAVRLDGTVYILYRAFGDDETSRIGLAWTRDGIHVDGRLDDPIYAPRNDSESAGTEDPRVTIIDDRMYMLYTAWNHKVAQIAMASIPVEAFLERRFDQWEYHGLGFPGLSNKDAVLYPEKFDGRYVIYHRIDPNMWVSYLEDLSCPWPRTGQKIITGPRAGMMWDGIKVGAGGQPIKTTHGWLNIYHGVDYERTYRLGVLFMALDDPARVLYQSPNAILEPEQNFEIGNIEGKDYWVPRVVFTCGAVPVKDKDVIGPDDEIFVYYGAADTAIGVARGRLRDIVPILGRRAGKAALTR